MHKVIHSDFELDLSKYKVSSTEENHWFSDQYFTKYTFPFKIKITDDLSDFFEFLRNYNSVDLDIIILVKYVSGNILEDAFLEIDEAEEEVSVTLRYGIEEFPNWNKKLSELPLEKLTVADIYAHAKTVITQTWPAVNYNFPQIHTDNIDSTEALWSSFEGIINNYQNNDFLINEVIVDVTYNRNLMQALPYFLHVIKKGFEDAGWTLKGDVLNNTTLQKKLMFTEAQYYNKVNQENLNLNVVGSEELSQSGNEASYLKTITLPKKGRYNITGTVQIYSRWKKWVHARIKYRGTTLWLKSKKIKNHHSGYLLYYDVDIIFDTLNDALADDIIFESSQYYRATNLLCDLYIDSVVLYDDEGQAIPNIDNVNEVDLTRTVPDMTFGELITLSKNWYNLDLDPKPREKEIWMDYIEKNINYADAFDLQKFEVKTPNRKFNKGLSFLLKFQDVNSEEYKFTEIFYDYEGVSSDSFVTDDKTKEILIKATPLPLMFRNGVQTAHAYSDDKSKMFTVLYSGLTDGLNLCEDPSPMLLPTIFQNNYEKWFEFRVSSITYRWTFKAWEEEIRGLKAKGKAYAYKNFHVVKVIPKKEIKPDLFEVEIELESLK